MIKITNIFVGLLFFALVFTGCVSTDSSRKGMSQKDAALVEQYITKAASFEEGGNLTSAVEHYNLALSLDPANPTALKKKKSIQKELKKKAQIHYKVGLKFDKTGRHDLARKEFLAALQNWPDHAGAKKMMTPGKVQVSEDYILHTIRPGESVSKLAIIYYGDYRNYPLISRFNNLGNATLVTVGQQVKVPAIQGVSIDVLRRVHGTYLDELKSTEGSDYAKAVKPMASIRQETAPGDSRMAETIPEPDSATSAATASIPQDATGNGVGETLSSELPAQDEKKMSAPEMIEKTPDQSVQEAVQPAADSGYLSASFVPVSVDKGVEYFNLKQYDKAIAEFSRLIRENPGNPEVSDYLYKSHFQQGLILFNKEAYLESKENFESAYAYNPDCNNCPEYMEKCLETYKEKHYTLGIHHFGREELKEAIQEWKQVKAIDPGYKDLASNLRKAEMLNKRLESIKKSGAAKE